MRRPFRKDRVTRPGNSSKAGIASFNQCQIALRSRGEFLVSFSHSLAIGTDSPTERAHQLADMFADEQVANSGLSELSIHILDEEFGEQRGPRGQFRIAFHAKHYERQHRCHHIESSLDRIGHSAIAVPLRLAGDFDRPMP